MAFKHPSFLELVATYGVPFVHNSTLDPSIASYHASQIVVIYHKPGDMDYPVSGAVGTQALVNIWGKMIFPDRIEKPYGSYVRIPKLDREILRRLEDLRIVDLKKLGSIRRYSTPAGERIIDLGDT